MVSQPIPTLPHSRSPPRPSSALSFPLAEVLILSAVATIYSSLAGFILPLAFETWCLGIAEVLKPHPTTPGCHR